MAESEREHFRLGFQAVQRMGEAGAGNQQFTSPRMQQTGIEAIGAEKLASLHETYEANGPSVRFHVRPPF
jgi:hypothetical protein